MEVLGGDCIVLTLLIVLYSGRAAVAESLQIHLWGSNSGWSRAGYFLWLVLVRLLEVDRTGIALLLLLVTVAMC